MHQISWPNRISLLRILLIGPFVVALLNLQDPEWGHFARWSALVVFALMAISDWLDGYLARRLRQESALGRFLDPLADKLLVTCSVVLLAHEGTHVSGMRLPSVVAVIAIGKDLIVVVGFCVIYLLTSKLFIEPILLGKLTTTLQLLMMIAILLSPDLPAGLHLLPKVLWWAASGVALMALVQYVRRGFHFTAAHEHQASGGTGGKPTG